MYDEFKENTQPGGPTIVGSMSEKIIVTFDNFWVNRIEIKFYFAIPLNKNFSDQSKKSLI